MITILATVFVFGLLVFVHEFGHFAAAKMAGMKVTEFAIGMGPALYQKKDGETLYSLRAVPLGGYNKIAGMDPDDPCDPRNFNNQSALKRFFVIAAGSVMNLILPVILFFIVITLSGMAKPVDQAVLGEILPNRPAAAAGLLPADRVLRVENKDVATWLQLVDAIQVRANQPTSLLVERQGKNFTVTVTPQLDSKSQRGLIGVISQMEKYQPGLAETASLSLLQTYKMAREILAGLAGILFSSQNADLSGPLGVAQMAGQVAQYGVLPLFNFAALLSINLGLINLFPIPVLDGGHLVMLLLEKARGKALGLKALERVQYAGMVILLGIMLFATMKDLIRFNIF